MDAKSRVLAGALGGVGGTIVLSALRGVLKKTGLVFDTAPTQVVDRVEELVAPEGFSPNTRRALAATAHVAYGVGAGTAFGLLRRESGGAGSRYGIPCSSTGTTGATSRSTIISGRSRASAGVRSHASAASSTRT